MGEYGMRAIENDADKFAVRTTSRTHVAAKYRGLDLFENMFLWFLFENKCIWLAYGLAMPPVPKQALKISLQLPFGPKENCLFKGPTSFYLFGPWPNMGQNGSKTKQWLRQVRGINSFVGRCT